MIYRPTLHRILHDTEGGGDQAGTAPEPTDATPATGDTGAPTEPTDTGTADPAQGDGQSPKTYTQEEVERKLRGQAKELEKARKEAERYKKAEEERKKAAMTEAERIQAEAEEAKAKAKELEARIQEMERAQQARDARRLAEAEARLHGPVDDAVLALIPEDAMETEDGKLTASAKKAMERFVKAHASLFRGKGGGGSSPPGATSGAKTGSQTSMTNSRNAAILRMGRGQ